MMFILGLIIGVFGTYVVMAIVSMCKDDERNE